MRQGVAYLEHPECVILTGQHGGQGDIRSRGRGETENVVDLVGAKVVVGVLAVDVMVVAVATTDE